LVGVRKLGVESDLVAMASRRGFFWPSAEIHGSVAGFWTIGPLGLRVKQRIISLWRKYFVEDEGAFEIETPDIMPESVFKASGHLEGFTDPLAQCKSCGKRFRADHLLEDYYSKRGDPVEGLGSLSVERLGELVGELGVRCPSCGGSLGKVKRFVLMYDVDVGATGGVRGYLRPETTQGSVVEMRRVYESMRAKLPLKIAQVGRSFRNEISPRNVLIRVREFTMAELQVFFDPARECVPDQEFLDGFRLRLLVDGERDVREFSPLDAVKLGFVPNRLIAYYMAKMQWFFTSVLGFPVERVRFRELGPEERAHYAEVHFDLEVLTQPYGWVECVNNAYRTDYDVRRHSEYTGSSLSVFEDGKHVVPHLYEPSMGIDRTLYCLLLEVFRRDEERSWLALKPWVAPYDMAVFPLVRRDGLVEKAREVFRVLRGDGLFVFYDEKGSIGRRYRRMDEVGTPFCVTVDHLSLEDNTVTVRDRDSMEQVRVGVDQVLGYVRSRGVPPGDPFSPPVAGLGRGV